LKIVFILVIETYFFIAYTYSSLYGNINFFLMFNFDFLSGPPDFYLGRLYGLNTVGGGILFHPTTIQMNGMLYHLTIIYLTRV